MRGRLDSFQAIEKMEGSASRLEAQSAVRVVIERLPFEVPKEQDSAVAEPADYDEVKQVQVGINRDVLYFVDDQEVADLIRASIGEPIERPLSEFTFPELSACSIGRRCKPASLNISPLIVLT